MSSKVETEEFFIPVWDCPKCKAKDQPLSSSGTWSKEGCPDISFWFCPVCKTVLWEESQVKEWWSLADLEVNGWKKTKPRKGLR